MQQTHLSQTVVKFIRMIWSLWFKYRPVDTYKRTKIGKDFKEPLHETALHVMNFPAFPYSFTVSVGMT